MRKPTAVLTAVPTGRLVMLGEPDDGTMMLMVGLVLNLLETPAAADRAQAIIQALDAWDTSPVPDRTPPPPATQSSRYRSYASPMTTGHSPPDRKDDRSGATRGWLRAASKG
jgi:hypothetical protein